MLANACMMQNKQRRPMYNIIYIYIYIPHCTVALVTKFFKLGMEWCMVLLSIVSMNPPFGLVTSVSILAHLLSCTYMHIIVIATDSSLPTHVSFILFSLYWQCFNNFCDDPLPTFNYFMNFSLTYTPSSSLLLLLTDECIII